jgi:GMP synthase-like glutamine amidotransferase
MHIHYFQHDHFEDLGFIGEWAAARSFTTSVTRFDLGGKLPAHDSYDWLVVLGGKMGVYESDKYPWIAGELKFIKQAIKHGKIVLGICLGSQMLAAALGARVYKNDEPEMGFFPVVFNENAHNDNVFGHFPKSLKVMHMHSDTFDLPKGAVNMATSEVTRCQAFRYGVNVFALQFHFEVTETNAPDFIREVTPELVPGRMVLEPDDMLEYLPECMYNNLVFSVMLDLIANLHH